MTDIRNPILNVVPTQIMPAIIPQAVSHSYALNFNQWDGNPAVWSVTTERAGAIFFPADLAGIGAAMQTLIAGGAGPISVTCVGDFVNAVVDSGVTGGRAYVSVRLENPLGFNVDTYNFDNQPGVYGAPDATRTYASLVARELVKHGAITP